MTQANDSARSLRTLASSASALSKAVLEVAADRLEALQRQLKEAEAEIDDWRKTARRLDGDNKELEAENKRLRDDVTRCGENWKKIYSELLAKLQRTTEAWNAEAKKAEDSVFIGEVRFETKVSNGKEPN